MDAPSGLKKGDPIYAQVGDRYIHTVYDGFRDGTHFVEARTSDGNPEIMYGYRALTIAKRVTKIITFSKNNMSKISILLTRLLSKDIQTLIKAGFLTERLDLTDEGTQALLVLMLDEKREQLVKIAEERLCE